MLLFQASRGDLSHLFNDITANCRDVVKLRKLAQAQGFSNMTAGRCHVVKEVTIVPKDSNNDITADCRHVVRLKINVRRQIY